MFKGLVPTFYPYKASEDTRNNIVKAQLIPPRAHGDLRSDLGAWSLRGAAGDLAGAGAAAAGHVAAAVPWNKKMAPSRECAHVCVCVWLLLQPMSHVGRL